MQTDILNLFRRQGGEYLSGEEISRQLHVSRTTIWKHIRTLKQQGYDIEAHTRKGYRLRQITDRLLPAEIAAGLQTRLLAAQTERIHHFNTVESTNNVAKKMAFDGCPAGTVIVSEEQGGGRGRLSRGWFSPNGKGIWMSVILRPPFAPMEAPKCTLMAAVAVCRGIEKSVGVSCGIKWPNDILWQGKKMVGILTEMSAEMDAINHVVIGIGINVNIDADDFPEEIRPLATSLSLVTGGQVARLELLIAVLQELEDLYGRVLSDGFMPVLDEWRSRSATLGQKVDVYGPDRTFNGEAVDIDEDGALLVKTAAGMIRVMAGDVSIRSKMLAEPQ
ncbi:MAG TPA: biotin--[acetyl-CoA-carboxylase] ligase [Patescibacteria group bacterium]|nr:biotin--[acetyl-CoA-carboxylase] ligase [Patescibacteria group bacterium]